MKASQIRDGTALLRFFAWLKDEIDTKENEVTEFEGCQRLTSFRALQDIYQGDSFHAIIGSGANGAIIHYHPTKDGSKVMNPNEVILIDSGGQYLDGTTDTTRTLHFRQPTPF